MVKLTDGDFLSKLNDDCVLHLLKYLKSYDQLVVQSFNKRLETLVNYADRMHKDALIQNKILTYSMFCDRSEVVAVINYFENVIRRTGPIIRRLNLKIHHSMDLTNRKAIFKSKQMLIMALDVIQEYCIHNDFECLAIEGYCFSENLPYERYAVLFGHIKGLELIEVTAPENGLEEMFKLTSKLERIKIKNVKISGQCLMRLNPALKDISLIYYTEDCILSIGCIVDFLKTFIRLQRISISEAVLRLFPIQILMQLNLMKFSARVMEPISTYRINEDLYQLQGMTELNNVRLRWFEIDNGTIDFIKTFKNLETLKLEYCWEIDTSGCLMKLVAEWLPNLKKFHYLPYATNITEDDYFNFIRTTSKLETFGSYFYEMCPAFYKRIVRIRKQKTFGEDVPVLLLKVSNAVDLADIKADLAKYRHIVDVLYQV